MCLTASFSHAPSVPIRLTEAARMRARREEKASAAEEEMIVVRPF